MNGRGGGRAWPGIAPARRLLDIGRRTVLVPLPKVKVDQVFPKSGTQRLRQTAGIVVRLAVQRRKIRVSGGVGGWLVHPVPPGRRNADKCHCCRQTHHYEQTSNHLAPLLKCRPFIEGMKICVSFSQANNGPSCNRLIFKDQLFALEVIRRLTHRNNAHSCCNARSWFLARPVPAVLSRFVGSLDLFGSRSKLVPFAKGDRSRASARLQSSSLQPDAGQVVRFVNRGFGRRSAQNGDGENTSAKSWRQGRPRGAVRSPASLA